jgi:tetratricopeptide (TPR) repeat protein
VASARELYEQSLSLKRRLGNRQAIAVTLSNLALLDQAYGDYGRAIQRSEEALRWRTAVGDVGGQIRTRTNLAELWLEKGHVKTALQHVDGALALAQRGGEQGTALSGALVTRAALELEIGRYERALAVAQDGMPIALRNGGRSDEARLRLVIAEASHELGRTTEALRDARTAVRSFRTSEDPRRLGQALLVESRLALAGGDAEGADGAACAAAELAASRHLPLLEARASYQRGVVALAVGATGAASKHLHHAKDVAYRLSIPELQARVYDALAVFHYGEGRSERALLWLRRCTGVFRGVVASMDDPDLETAYVETPWRAAAIARMRSWLHAAQPT